VIRAVICAVVGTVSAGRAFAQGSLNAVVGGREGVGRIGVGEVVGVGDFVFYVVIYVVFVIIFQVIVDFVVGPFVVGPFVVGPFGGWE